MRRFQSFGLLLFLGLLIASSAGFGVGQRWRFASPAAAAALAQSATWSPCDVVAWRQIAPSVVLQGEEATVTLASQQACRPRILPSVIMLVIDNSGSVFGGPAQQVRRGAMRFVRRLDLDNNPHVRVGVIHFDDGIWVTCEPRYGEANVLQCLDPPGGAGATNLAERSSRPCRSWGGTGWRSSPPASSRRTTS